jgi:hypothetical protein
MLKTKLPLAVAASVALIGVPPLATASSVAADEIGSNTGVNAPVAVPQAATASPLGDAAIDDQFARPTQKYKKGTGRADTGDLDFTVVDRVRLKGDGCSGMNVTFNQYVETRSVPDGGWLTWSDVPFSESPTPDVFYPLGSASLTLTFSRPTRKAGAEVEPNPYDGDHTYTVQYVGEGSIEVTASGEAGARLGAAKTVDKFTQMIITDVSTTVPQADFAIAQIRAKC